MNKEFVIIGAGPAGLCAALEAARHGVDVMLIDENDRPGGQLFLQTHKFFGSRHHLAGVRGFQIACDLLAEAQEYGLDVWLNSTVWGLFPDNRVAFAIDDEEQDSVVAEYVLVASGALEKGTFFPGWTKPGVMGAGAAQKMMHVHLVLPGRKVLVVGSGNVGLILAYQLAQAGAQVQGVVEALPCISGYQVHAGKIRRLGIPILTGHTIARAVGAERIEGAVVARCENGKVDPDAGMELACDLICLAVGMRPFDELIRAVGIDVQYVGGLGGFVPVHNDEMETTRKNVFVAGDLTGIEEANTAMDEGRLVGTVVAQRAGRLSEKAAEQAKSVIRGRLRDLRIGTYGDNRADGKRSILEFYQKRTQV